MMSNNSLGISPLLATILLIAIAVATITMLSGWVTTTMGTTQNTVTNRTNEGVACAAAEIVIDDVYSGAGSGSRASAIVRNSGGSDNLQIVSAQLYDKFGNNFTTVSSLPINLNKGQMATLSFNYSILPTTANDSAHGINNGTLTNGASYSLGGRYGSGISFDGMNDYVNLGNPAILKITSAVTVEAWVNPTAHTPSGWEHIFVKRYNVSPWIVYGLATGISGQKFTFRISVGGIGKTVNSDTSFTPNQWTHVVGTYDGSTMSLYINGILQSSTTSVTGSIDDIDNGNVIGGWGGSETWNGIVDDVAVWNRSLTNAEINSSMNSGPLTVSNTNDLVGYWKFDEGKGILSCPSDFSRVVVTTSCGGVSAEFTKSPKC